MTENWLNKLFHKHKYKKITKINATFQTEHGDILDVPILLYGCAICGKRIVIRDSNLFYTATMLQRLKKWKHHEMEIEDI